MHFCDQPLAEMGDLELGMQCSGLDKFALNAQPKTVRGVQTALRAMMAGVWECGSEHHWPWLTMRPNEDLEANGLCFAQVRDNNALCTHGRLTGLRQGVCAAVTLAVLRPDDAWAMLGKLEYLRHRMGKCGDDVLIQIGNHMVSGDAVTDSLMASFLHAHGIGDEPATFTREFMMRHGHAAKAKYGHPIQDVVVGVSGIFDRAVEPDMNREAFEAAAKAQFPEVLERLRLAA